jgi:hypothetical protein
VWVVKMHQVGFETVSTRAQSWYIDIPVTFAVCDRVHHFWDFYEQPFYFHRTVTMCHVV